MSEQTESFSDHEPKNSEYDGQNKASPEGQSPDDILEKVRETDDTNEKIKLLLELVITLLTQSRNFRMSKNQQLKHEEREREQARQILNIIEHQEPNQIPKGAGDVQPAIASPGSQSDDLSSSRSAQQNEELGYLARSKKEIQDKIDRWSAVTNILESGTAASEFRKDQETVIDECDAQLRSETGAASRETLERKKLDAIQNIETLNEIRSERLTQVSEFNQTYDLRKILANLTPEERRLNPFWGAEFGIDECFNIVLENITYDFTQFADAAETYRFGGEIIKDFPWLPDHTGVYVTGDTIQIKLGKHMKGVDTLTFRKSANGTYVLTAHAGDFGGRYKTKERNPREWQRKVNAMESKTGEMQQRKLHEAFSEKKNNGEVTEYFGPISMEILQKAKASTIRAVREMLSESEMRDSRIMPRPYPQGKTWISFGPRKEESTATRDIRFALSFLEGPIRTSSTESREKYLQDLNDRRGDLGLPPIIIVTPKQWK